MDLYRSKYVRYYKERKFKSFEVFKEDLKKDKLITNLLACPRANKISPRGEISHYS